MPDTDDQPVPAPSAAPSVPRPAPPSLMGNPPTPTRTRAPADAGQMRMLDELEAVVRPRQAEREGSPPRWLIALLAGAVLLIGAVWWIKRERAGTAVPAPMAAATPAVRPVSPVSTPVAAAAAPAAETAAPAPAPSVAVIENVPASAAPVAEIAPGEAAASATRAAPASAAARPPVRTAQAGAAALKKPDGKVTTVVTPTGGKWTVTVADASAADDTPGRRPAAAAPRPPAVAEKPLPNPATAVAKPARSDDPDVKLLSALLAHVERAGPSATLGDEDQLTIAQIVKRCDARPAAEVRECRRRICEGYWGKAEACPAPAAATAAARKG